MTLRTLTALCALFAGASVSALGQGSSGFVPGTIFLVRHAEWESNDLDREIMRGRDRGLSEAGRARAVSLATLLKATGISAIFVTDYKATRETAAPLANSLGIVPAPFADTTELVARLRRTVGSSLVVGHLMTLSEVQKALGVSPRVVVTPGDYDKLLIVELGSTGSQPPRTLLLHYR